MAIGRLNIGLTGVQPGGLAKVIPSSVAVGSGTGSTSGNGIVTFSGASSISLNNVFSSSYTNYRLIVFLTPSAFGTVKLRLRASGTDATGSNYFFQQLRAYGTTIATSNLTETGWQFGASFNDDAIADYKAITCEIFRPNEAVNTKYLFTHFQGSDRPELNNVGGVHTVASAYDGFTIYPSTGTITGTVNVYGYN